MTLAQLLDWARAHPDAATPGTPAHAVVTLLGVSWPCGYEQPITRRRIQGPITIEILAAPLLDIDEARGIAAGILHACDEAEGKR